MARELFGTDGLRARANDYPLDGPTVRRIGQAVGTQFDHAGMPVLVGWDTRESSPEIVSSLTDGLTSVGAHVKSVGIIPTPGLAYLTKATDAAAGVMVTASHNPYTDNGIKIFRAGGQKLTDDEEKVLNEAIVSGEFSQAEGSRESAEDLCRLYEDFLFGSANGTTLEGLKLIVDSANGAASEIAPRLFKKLGAEVKSLFDQPDGRNINVNCGATNIKTLQTELERDGFDAGVAFDGDADRLIMADSRGYMINGDFILYILAISHKLKGVISTVMSNYGLEQALKQQGIELRRTAVGDRYVLEGLATSGYKLGGEQSGHIILADLSPTGDGLLAAVQTLIAVKQSSETLAQWRDKVKMVEQAIVNVKVSDKAKLNDREVQDLIEREAESLDGQGRLLVRASGTEPLIRVMVEGDDAKKRAAEIAAKLEKPLAGYN